MYRKKWLIISCGDIEGVGYELVLKLFDSYPFLFDSFLPLVVGSLNWLKYVSLKYHLKFFPFVVNPEIISSIQFLNLSKKHCFVIDILPKSKISCIKKFSGKISFLTLEKVSEIVENFLKSNIDFFVLTMPVSKSKINRFYKDFKGHTEYFADRFGISYNKVSMLMKAEDKEGNVYRVLLLTRHIPLSKVPDNLNPNYIFSQVNNVIKFINKYETNKVKEILFCNLNPHGGEEGHIGKEEKSIILKGIKLLEKNLKNTKIKFPMQTSDAFKYASYKKNHLIVTTYHDQAMIPLKLLCGYNIANITVGLPFIRVSPGHGTASDIALKNKVDISGAVLCLKSLLEFNKKS